MTEFTRDYIADHMKEVHTPDSFARSIAYQALSYARDNVNTGARSVRMDSAITVSPIEKTSCIEICVDTPIGPICYHVEL